MFNVCVMQLTPIIIITFLLLKDEHLRKRDTPEAEKIFRISVITIIIAMLYFTEGLCKFSALKHMVPKVLKDEPYAFLTWGCIAEMLAAQAVIEWNLFVEYAIFRSNDYEAKKRRLFKNYGIAVSIGFVIVYLLAVRLFGAGLNLISILSVAMIVFFAVGIYFMVRSVLAVRKAHKTRKPPSFLRLDGFIIPVVLTYLTSFFSIFLQEWDARSLGLAIAVVLTWRSVTNRYKYVDPYTGFFNRDFLKSMNEYMEKSGYPNGTGVLFKAPGSGDRLIPVLDSFKPEDSEIFSFGDGEFLLMAGPQKESVIRLLINGVKLSASEQGDIPEIETRYAIRNEDETTEEFTARLLALSSDSDGSR